MKKLFAFFLLSALFAVSFSFAQVKPMIHNGDTVVNTGSKLLDLTLGGSFTNVAVQLVATKISGTVAGTAKLYGSLNGTDYVVISTDTLALANQTKNTFIWNVAPSKYQYYRISTVGVGTMSATVNGYVLGRP